MNNDFKLILNYLNEKRGFDFSGYRTPMVERRIKQLFLSTKYSNYKDYLQYLKANHDQIFDKLYRSLSRLGYLVLGEAEIPSKKYQRYF